MYLKNDILKLRAPEPEDLELLYIWENMLEYWETGNTRQPYSKFALKQYISQINSNLYESNQLRLMMVDAKTNETVGTVDLFDFDLHHGRIALGLFVAPEFQKKGYAKAALQIVEEYVFGFLKINQLYCHIAKNNRASIHMFEKENFSKTILRNWIKSSSGFEDIIVFQQFIDEFTARKENQLT
ncbi:MAG: GNAT family N-acetyltransferase [Paludibacter sp.]|nr:GNAT family N-acetyltransferase [Paludibacter sp.]